jgi:hypothetical protein
MRWCGPASENRTGARACPYAEAMGRPFSERVAQDDWRHAAQGWTKDALERVLEGLAGIGIPVLFLAHPRTRHAAHRFGLTHLLAQLHTIESVGHTELLDLAHAAMPVAGDLKPVTQLGVSVLKGVGQMFTASMTSAFQFRGLEYKPAGSYEVQYQIVTGAAAQEPRVARLTKAIALDGRAFNIACGQIDIGNAATDMTSHMNSGSLQPNGTTVPEPTMNVQHVVDALLYMAGLPLEANVQFMTVMATTMPFIGRG